MSKKILDINKVEKSDLSASSNLFCVNCANIFSDEHGALITCNSCGYKLERTKYGKLINYSSNAVLYGFLLRRYYQIEYQQVSIRRKPSLPLFDVLVFAGMAGLSGIIGNAAYDLLSFD